MLFENICSDASRVRDSWNLAKTRVRMKKLPCAKMQHFSVASEYMSGAKDLKQ